MSTSYTPPLTTRPIQNFGGSACGGDLFNILRVSCNTAFAQMGVDLGPEVMVGEAEAYGFNATPPLDLPVPAPSAFPPVAFFDRNTPALAQAAIGQNDVQATPLQMALVAAGVANGGRGHAAARDARGAQQRRRGHRQRGAHSRGGSRCQPENAAVMRDAMVNVVERGTATRMQIPGIVGRGQDRHRPARHRPAAFARMGHRLRAGRRTPRGHRRHRVGTGGGQRADRWSGGRADRQSSDGDHPRCTRSAVYRSLGWLDMSQSDATVLNQRYELQRRVGRGGMADVFLARDQLLDRPVALKVLFPEFAQDPAFVERFRREAQAAANLNHPNIVGVYDWGEAAGTYYIVMEYIDGRSLADVLRSEGRVRPDRAPTPRSPSRSRSPRRTRAASSTATSSRPTSSSPATGR